MVGSVVSGDYKGKFVPMFRGTVYIEATFFQRIYLTNESVESYELVDDGTASTLQGKKPRLLVSITFRDGKKSLIAMDEKYYRSVMINCFK